MYIDVLNKENDTRGFETHFMLDKQVGEYHPFTWHKTSNVFAEMDEAYGSITPLLDVLHTMGVHGMFIVTRVNDKNPFRDMVDLNSHILPHTQRM